ncbi:acetyltransferase protein [Rutstroemia sp. NJR-2017a WRK4]|nr:acetyltransferase protein [Rutstroemia sp. NJR-2017a WRK4]
MARHVPMPIPRELDLRRANATTTTTTANIVVNRMNAVPGFLASAAFFTFLRANLVLPPSTLNSTSSTPILDASSSQTLPPLRPSFLATMTSNMDDDDIAPPNPLEGVPPLTTTVLTSEDDKVAALKLVADSIAQQRQIASRAVIFHPLTLALYIAILGVVAKLMYKESSDAALLVTTYAGVTMACLVAVRSATAGYIQHAEDFNWSFAKTEDGEEDTIIGSKYGEDIIGALILRIERATNGKKKGKNGKMGGKGVVRAWTTKMRYRGTGVGTALLEEAVRKTRERLGNSAEIGFAQEHANSKMVLPELFNGTFRQKERSAALELESVVDGMDTGRKKR